MELAERTATVIRGALRDGVVPGGGSCAAPLQTRVARTCGNAPTSKSEQPTRSLASALAAPTRTIASNAGFDASDVVAEIRQSQNGAGFDVLRGEIVDMIAAGIVDSASVTKAAVYAAISSAALALTIDVLVHRSEQAQRADAPAARSPKAIVR